ncbi:uncharacterized protein [Heptranchias perlo]|uniref:uncharacterized protein n=1 Tax=Heptranchias perlo TaxID=212740 RepID=UPI00355A39B3
MSCGDVGGCGLCSAAVSVAGEPERSVWPESPSGQCGAGESERSVSVSVGPESPSGQCGRRVRAVSAGPESPSGQCRSVRGRRVRAVSVGQCGAGEPERSVWPESPSGQCGAGEPERSVWPESPSGQCGAGESERSVWGRRARAVSAGPESPSGQCGAGEPERSVRGRRVRAVSAGPESPSAEADHTPQMKFRDRQRFFEDVFQPDADFYLTAAHLQIEHQRPPIGSVSSMEVNVDLLEQVDLMDMSDQEALDVFLNSSMDGCEASTLPEEQFYNSEITLKVPHSAEMKSRMSSTSSSSTDPNSMSSNSMSSNSTSSNSTDPNSTDPNSTDPNSMDPNSTSSNSTSSNSTDPNSTSSNSMDPNSTSSNSLELSVGSETPLVQSDEEDVQVDNALLTPSKDKEATVKQSENES